MKERLTQICVAVFLCATAAAQTPPSFEVAEIKVNRSAVKSHGDMSNGRLVVTNLPLRALIAEAWTLGSVDIAGPSWLDDVRVDIVAKASSPFVADSELSQMVQTLLKERMKLVAHLKDRAVPVYVLSVWKGSPKAMSPSEMPAKPEDADCSLSVQNARAHLDCRHMPMASFAHELLGWANRYVDKRIVDQTALTGAWDFKLEWTPLAQLESEGGLTL